MISKEIQVIANQASLKISANDKVLQIKHIFRYADKSTLGVLIMMICGAFLIVAPFVKSSDSTTKILGMLIGLPFFILSLLTLVRQVTDGVKITNREITFQYNLKTTTLRPDQSMKIKLTTAITRNSRPGKWGSSFISVTHHLKTIDKEQPILYFQMYNPNADKAIKLGNEITRMINDRLREFN